MTAYEKMQSGMLYSCADPALAAMQTEALELLYDFNATRPSEGEKRETLMKQMFASIGEGVYIEPPLHANWAGKHVHLGNRVYMNFGVTLVDDTEITIGDDVMLAPNVILATAAHPIHPALRARVYQYNLPIHIGNRVWIGAGAIVMPGVTIGDDTVIGAGSVVTKDIPAGVVAVGSPCRVIREISAHDAAYYDRNREIPKEDLIACGILTDEAAQ